MDRQVLFGLTIDPKTLNEKVVMSEAIINFKFQSEDDEVEFKQKLGELSMIAVRSLKTSVKNEAKNCSNCPVKPMCELINRKVCEYDPTTRIPKG